MAHLYFGGKIYVEREVFADSMLVYDGIIEAVGSHEEVTATAAQKGITVTQTTDLDGKTVIPGINDSHQHTFGVGKLLMGVNLASADSIGKMVQTGISHLEKHPLTAGQVLVGRGWNQDNFTDEKRMPTRHDLDRITTEYPVIFTRACGHILCANSRALQLAGIGKDTVPVQGGEIYRDADGTPNGLISENAIEMINTIIPPITAEYVAQAVSLAMKSAAGHGITTLQTNDIDGAHWQTVQQGYHLLYETNRDAIRICHQSTFTDPTQYQQFVDDGYGTGGGDDMLMYGPLKLYSDGSLGARTAYMKQPYADDPSTQGIPTLTQQQLDSLVQTADQNGCQVIVHCIGNGAMEMVLDAFDKVTQNGNPHRHGIVHCQITDRQLIQRFADRDILAFVQPIFIHYDMTVVESRVGSQLAQTSYVFGDMYRMGIHTSYGTDSPVEDMNPWENIYCAITRSRLDGRGEYLPDQKVDIFDAIDQYTVGSAYAQFSENKKGRLKSGFLADFAVLDRDIFTATPQQIMSTKSLLTVVGGRTVYEG
ncbi:MAG: amidohydrolase [Oscillospiraceae bacterium]|nr:amidohydrolase [Oscillospiraceae bacterium]